MPFYLLTYDLSGASREDYASIRSDLERGAGVRQLVRVAHNVFLAEYVPPERDLMEALYDGLNVREPANELYEIAFRRVTPVRHAIVRLAGDQDVDWLIGTGHEGVDRSIREVTAELAEMEFNARLTAYRAEFEAVNDAPTEG